MPIELERSYRFAAAHRYYRPKWSEAENLRRFGKCANAPGHGHNYRLTVRVAGSIDLETGFLIDLPELDRIVASTVLARIDHQHANFALAEFGPEALIPSTENLVVWVRDRLAEGLPEGVTLRFVRLAEDDDLAATWTPSGD